MYKLDSAGVYISEAKARHSCAHSERVGQLEVAVVVSRLVLNCYLEWARYVVTVWHVDYVSSHSQLRVRCSVSTTVMLN